MFETGNEYFSTNDLQQFQLQYYLRVQSAESVGDRSLITPPSAV